MDKIDQTEIDLPPVEVSSDGRTVWVNGQEKCLARFCRFSTEYFQGETPQSIKHNPENLSQDWEDFVINIGLHFVVDVSKHKPQYIEK